MPTPGPTAAGYCPGDWEGYRAYCYLFKTMPTDALSWNDAQTSCADVNGTLLTVHNADENAFLVTSLASRTGEEIEEELWLGVVRNYAGNEGCTVHFVLILDRVQIKKYHWKIQKSLQYECLSPV